MHTGLSASPALRYAKGVDLGRESCCVTLLGELRACMALYQLYFLTPAGKMLRRESIEASTHDEALARVKPDPRSIVELWLGGELVHRATPTAES